VIRSTKIREGALDNLALKWVNTQKRRYYSARLYTDLLGYLILMRVWGSLDSERSQKLVELCESWLQG
jgi:hypothetical protein